MQCIPYDPQPGIPAAEKSGTAEAVPLEHISLRGLHQLDDRHLSGVTAALTDANHAGVATVALSILGSDLLEQLVGHIFLGDVAQGTAVSSQVALLAQGIIFSTTG